MISGSVFNPKDYGAVGDGVANDTNAFIAASAALNAAGGGTLYIPAGTYQVFSQTANPAPSSGSPYWVSAGNIIDLSNCNGVRIVFDGANLIAASGLKYGSFNPLTGEVYNPTLPFTNAAYAAYPGDFIDLTSCTNVEIVNAKLNGNNTTYTLGGQWGDTGRQLPQTGIKCTNSSNVAIINADVSYCGLDGIYATGTANQRINVSIDNAKSAYNGRQGISWTGGNGLTITNSAFTYTGAGGVASSPSAGIDIEDNGQGCYDGLFDNCEFFGNVGAEILTQGTSDRIKFNRCVIGASAATRGVWPASAGVLFTDCSIYGDITNTLNTQFRNCYITNKSYRGVAQRARFIDLTTSYATFNNCVIDSYDSSSYNWNIGINVTVSDCTFLMSQTDPAQRFRVGIINAALINNTLFQQNYTFTSGAPDITLAGEHTFVESSSFNPFGSTKNTGTGLAFFTRSGPLNCYLAAGYTIAGTGSPETVVTALVGCLYTNKSGGASTTLYVKESGSGNTGWIAK